MKFLEQVLLTVAAERRMVKVETDHGILHGYLCGWDDSALLMLAKFTAGEAKEVSYATCLVPRTKVMILDSRTLTDESLDLQDLYLENGGEDFIEKCIKKLSKEAE